MLLIRVLRSLSFLGSIRTPPTETSELETYVKEGALAAIEAVLEITDNKRVNAIGYCIGGTLLTIALAHMAKKRMTG